MVCAESFLHGHGAGAGNLHKWGIAPSDKCECGMAQPMSHIVNKCPLQRRHLANDDAVNWLKRMTMKELTKLNEQ